MKTDSSNVVFTVDLSAAALLVEELKKRNWTITTAESCTGGLVSASIVTAPGASAVLKQAYVTYAEEAKEALAGVLRETIENETVYSEQCAEEMAVGAARAAGSDVSVSVTGLAGPDGGTPEKPVGLVYIGVCICGRVFCEKNIFSGDRTAIRNQAADRAVKYCLELVGNYCAE